MLATCSECKEGFEVEEPTEGMSLRCPHCKMKLKIVSINANKIYFETKEEEEEEKDNDLDKFFEEDEGE
ncbi:MAG: hypothetical protein ABIH99_00195 [Candidatus Micrarchaeota archaeon]